MKTTQKLGTIAMLFALCFIGTILVHPGEAKASSYEGISCYSKNCKLATKNKYAKVKLTDTQITVTGWIYTEKVDEKKGIYRMQWKKTTKKYDLAEEINYRISGSDDELSADKMQEAMKKYGKTYDSVTIYAEDGKANSILLDKVNSTLSGKKKINSGIELRVYSKGSSGHGAGEVCPEEYGKVSISKGYLVIKGVITDTSGKRYTKMTRKFKIKGKVKKSLIKQIKKLSSKKSKDTFFFDIKNGKVIGKSMRCGSGSEV